MVELLLHSPICLHGVMLDQLGREETLLLSYKLRELKLRSEEGEESV
jgi:hypothetical protein